MNDRARMREEVARVMDGDAEGVAYHGPSTKSNLAGITHSLASARPIAEGHSIWELTSHIKIGREWSLARLKGEKPDLEWWPPIQSQSPKDWELLLKALDGVQAEILAALQTSKNEDVHAAVRFLIHHELYHSGQIAVLRRALGLAGRPG